jgi:hypothetical protein
MRKPTKDPIREDRIHNEAIVDAYGPEEKAMSWYYYLRDMLVLIRWQDRNMAVPLYPNWLPSIRTNPPPKPSVIGITG